jgi:hypothetical protein
MKYRRFFPHKLINNFYILTLNENWGFFIWYNEKKYYLCQKNIRYGNIYDYCVSNHRIGDIVC